MRLGQTELLLILALAILMFGTTRLAGLGQALGRSIREFKQELRGQGEENRNNVGDNGNVHEQ